MKAPTNVYKLAHFYDDPRFEGFFSKSTLPGWAPPGGKPNRRWKPARLSPTWKSPRFTGRVRKFNDFPCWGTMPVFSDRAVNALRDFLEPNGELLPMRNSVGTYFAYNLRTIADVLDERRSKIDLGTVIWRYELFARKLKDLTIFRMWQDHNITYVTEPFVRRAREHQLVGMDFQKIWPFPKNVDWWQVARDETISKLAAGIRAMRRGPGT
jgi:hypothetical protein